MALNLALLSFQRLEEASVIRRVSTTTAGSQGAIDSYRPSLSSNGRYVLFESASGDLVAGDTNGRSDVFLKDMQTGTLTLISSGSDGTIGNDYSNDAQFSADGQSIIFTSKANNLVVGDNNNSLDVFRKNLNTGIVVRLTMSFDGVEANSHSNELVLTPDGRYAVFTSYASNLAINDTNSASDIFLRDLATGGITRASVGRDGIQADSHSSNAVLSSDGRYVAFQSFATNLVGGDTNSSIDIFYKDLLTDAIIRISTSASGTQANNSSRYAQLSANGRYVAFESDASNLVDGDTNSASDVFRKDLLTGEIVRVSTSSGGVQAIGSSHKPSISADGRYVLFESTAHDLVGATSFNLGIFRKDLMTGEIIRLSSVGSATPDGNSTQARFSADGRYIVFETMATDLITGDTNGNRKDIIWVDADRIADGAAIREGRFVELNFGASPTS
ncbi:MAG: hypothetical protein ABW003_03000, partial [Microvirga sp.]